MEEIKLIDAPAREWKFQLAGSEKVWALPLMGSLPISQARDIARLADAKTEGEMLDASFELFERLCPGLCETVTTDQLAAILTGWREASGINPGESRASSD